jgi:hypothetical protein
MKTLMEPPENTALRMKNQPPNPLSHRKGNGGGGRKEPPPLLSWAKRRKKAPATPTSLAVSLESPKNIALRIKKHPPQPQEGCFNRKGGGGRKEGPPPLLSWEKSEARSQQPGF